MERNRQNFFSFCTIFCPFTPHPSPLTTQRIKIYKKWKKPLRYQHFTIILPVYHKWQSYDIWFLRNQHQQTDFLSSWAISCPFMPVTAQKNRNIKKILKTPGDIIILYKCTKNHDHKLYCSWDMAHGGCNVCYFPCWTISYPFTLPPPPL